MRKTTDAQARASGLCEALERHSGVFRGDEPRRKARLADLGASAIDVRECLLFSERQYAARATSIPESERHDILAAVAALPRDVTVLLIEHDMDLVFSFADRISVLVNGAMLVEGPPAEVARDPRVKAVYLGEAADA